LIFFDSAPFTKQECIVFRRGEMAFCGGWVVRCFASPFLFRLQIRQNTTLLQA